MSVTELEQRAGVLAVPLHQGQTLAFPVQAENKGKQETVIDHGEAVGTGYPSDATWELISGVVEAGETHFSAMMREIREELLNLLEVQPEFDLAEFNQIFAVLIFANATSQKVAELEVIQTLHRPDGQVVTRGSISVNVFKWLLTERQFSYLQRLIQLQAVANILDQEDGISSFRPFLQIFLSQLEFA